MSHHFVGGLFATLAGFLVWITVKKIAGEGDALAHGAAKEVTSADAKFLTGQIDAGKFNCGVQLCPVVVKRSGWVANLPVELLKLQRVVADQIGFKRANAVFGALSAAPHFT